MPDRKDEKLLWSIIPGKEDEASKFLKGYTDDYDKFVSRVKEAEDAGLVKVLCSTTLPKDKIAKILSEVAGKPVPFIGGDSNN